MLENIKKHRKIIISFFITILFFGLFYKVDYSRCTFRMYVNDPNVEYYHFLNLGRYIIALWWKIVSLLKFNLNQTYFVTFIMSIVFMTLSLYKTQDIVEKLIFINKNKSKKDNVLILLLSIMIILNPFVIELLLFIEKGCMIMSLFFSVWAAEKILDFFDDRKIKSIILSSIFILLSSMSYQGSTLIYLSFAFLFVAIKAKSFREFIINNIVTVIPFLVGYGGNYMCIKLFSPAPKVVNELNIFSNLKIILSRLPEMLIDNYGTLPRYFILVCLIIIFFIILIKELKNKNRSLSTLLMSIYLYIAILIVTIVPQFVLDASSIQLLARSSVSYGAIIGILIAFMLNKNIIDDSHVNFLYAFMILFVILEYIYMQITIIDHYKINRLDLNTAKQIQVYIDEYEIKNNIEIKNIIYYSDKNVENSYPNLKNYYQINQKVISMPGRGIQVLQYVSNRKYNELSQKDIEIEKYFLEKDWDYFSKEQMIFRGNELHLCVF